MIPFRTCRLIFVFAALAAASAGVVGCNDSPTAPTQFAEYSQTDLRLGTGTLAAIGGAVTVNYTGWFFDQAKPEQKGPQFDSTVGQAPFTFTLGAGSVIAGWEQGVAGMQVGGVRRLVIPPSLGYGGTRYMSIPPYSTLVFEVELVGVQ